MALDLNALSTKQAVSAIFIGYYDRAPAPNGLNYWVADIEENGFTLADVARAFALQQESQDNYPALGTEGSTDLAGNVAFVTAIFQNLFGRAPNNIEENDGADNFWVNELQNGADVGQLILDIMSGAQGDDLAILTNKIEVAVDYADAAEAGGVLGRDPAGDTILDGVTSDPATVVAAKNIIDAEFPVVEPSVPGEEFFLTSRTDVIEGTANDDDFYAYVAQNELAGGLSNSLSSADRLDGGAGNDYLFAELSLEFFGTSGFGLTDIQPRITDIETIEIEARDFGLDGEGFFFGGGEGFESTSFSAIVVDAKHIKGHDSIGSLQSDGDLKIENLTTLESDGVTARNTADLTITMDHTDNFNSDGDASDLIVLFDNDYLLSGQTSVGTADFFLLDQDAELRLLRGQPAEGRLDEIDKNGIRFSINGQEVRIEFDGDLLNEANAAEINSHDAFIAALQAPLQQAIADGLLPAGTKIERFDFPAVVFDDEGLALNRAGLQDGSFSDLIPSVRVISGDGSPVTPLGFTAPDEITGEFNVFGRFDNDFAETEEPITIDVDLHKVGRGGNGGDLIIGGKANTTPEGIADGIKVFNLNVIGAGNDDPDGFLAKPSSLGTVTSTGKELEVVNIQTDPEDAARGSFASLEIRNGFNEVGRFLSSSSDNLRGRESGDLKTINAANFLGDLTLGTADFPVVTQVSSSTGGSQRIINADTITATGGGDVTLNLFYSGSEDNQEYRVNTGSGDDMINALIDGDAVDAVTESLAMTTGDGNDSVIVQVANSFGNFGATTTPAPGDFSDFGSAFTSGQLDADGVSAATTDLLKNLSIDTGTGEDYVEVRGMGTWDIDAQSGSDMVYINSGGDISRGDLFEPTESGTDRFEDIVLYKAKLAISVAGFESVVDINTGSDFILTEAELNVALLAALEANPEIARLIEAEVGTTDQNLIVTALVDGINEVGFQIRQPELIASGSPLAGSAQVLIAPSDVAGLGRDLIAVNGATSAQVDTAANIVANLGAFTTPAPHLSDTHAGGLPAAFTLFGDTTAADGYTGTVFGAIADAEPAIPQLTGSDTDNNGVGGIVNNSVINMGTGANDLVVLSANHDREAPDVDGTGSQNTLVFDDLNAGKVSIVNWFNQETTANLLTNGSGNQVNGNHLLDFTAFLTNFDTDTGSAASRDYVEIEVEDNQGVNLTAAGVTMSANSMHFLTVDQLEALAGTPTNYTLGNLSAANLKMLIELDGALGITYGAEPASDGDDAGQLAPGTTARTSIIAVENIDGEIDFDAVADADQLNSTNHGEYKFFQVVYGLTEEANDSVVTVNEITVADFGDSIELTGLEDNLVGGLNII